MSTPTPDADSQPAVLEEAPPAPQADGGNAPADEPSGVAVRPVAFSPLDGQQTDGDSSDGADARPLDVLLGVQVPVVVELGHTEMPIQDLLALKPGSVLELDKLAGEPVDLLIRDHVVARGEIIVVDDCLGVRVTHIVDPADRVKNLGG